MDFKNLAAHLGIDEKDFIELAELFVATTHNDIIKIENSLAAEDALGVAAAAHSIKGAAGNMGFEALADIAKTMEMEAKDGHLEHVEKNLIRLNQVLEPIEKKAAQ